MLKPATLTGWLAICCLPSAAPAQQPLSPLPPDGFVTLEQITGDFSQQPEAAATKYEGMRITVYGRVGQVQRSGDEDGDPLTVFLQLPENPTPDVKCVFNEAGVPHDGDVQVGGGEADFFKRDIAGDITAEIPLDIEGQMVAIRGTFDGFVAGDIVLKSCRRLTPAAVAALLAKHGLAGATE
ncbi:MAG: OB-fold putative lipoprotein [Terrimicrobiaceae bacterium]|nr:OB-fold putative lipoprotein [Terrimicrobiaceae bacterium]